MAQTFVEKAWFSPINVLRTAHPHTPSSQPVSRPGIKPALQAKPRGRWGAVSLTDDLINQ